MRKMLFTWIALFSVSCLWGKEGAAIPAARDGWAGPHSGWYTKQASKLAGKTIDILILGDSINMAWQNPVAKPGGGKEIWNEFFWKYSMSNFALAGDRTEHLLWRITEGKQLDGYKARLVILMIGINNAHQVRPGAEKPDTPHEAADGVRAILQMIRRKQPDAKILLLGALPAHFDGCNLLPWTEEFNRRIMPFADGETILFSDFRESFMKEGKELNQELFMDGIHLNQKGFTVYASRLKPVIEANLPGVEPRSAQSIPKGAAWRQWSDFISTLVKKNAGKTFDILLFGDNQLWGFSQAKGKKAWEKNFGKYSAFNLAYVHDRTEQLINRVKDRRQLDGYRARLVIIQAGLANFYADNLTDTPAAAAYGVSRLLEYVRQAQPDAKILLLGIPAVHYPGNNLIKRGAEADQRLAKLADGKTVFFQECASIFLNPDGSLKQELYENGLMFNENGYECFARRIHAAAAPLLQ